MRHIDYNFNGKKLEIPNDLLQHDLLIVVDGVIKAPQNECGGDYRIDKNHILFAKWWEGVCVQLIPVTEAILTDSLPILSYDPKSSP